MYLTNPPLSLPFLPHSLPTPPSLRSAPMWQCLLSEGGENAKGTKFQTLARIHTTKDKYTLASCAPGAHLILDRCRQNVNTNSSDRHGT